MWVLEDDSDTAGCDDGTTDVVAVFILRVAVVCDEGIEFCDCEVSLVAGCDDGTTDVVAVFILRVAVVCDEGIEFCDCEVSLVTAEVGSESDEA